MQKLLATIFLSLFISCGAKNKSGPSELLIINHENKGRPTTSLFMPELEIVYLKDVDRSNNVLKLDSKTFFNKHFYSHYSEQIHDEAIRVPEFDSKNRMFFKARSNTNYLAKLKIRSFKRLKTLTVQFFNLDSPEERVIIQLGNNDLEREFVDFNFDTRAFSSLDTMVFSIVDFDYKVSGVAHNHLHNLNKFYRQHYHLKIDGPTKLQESYVSTKLSIANALKDLNISHQTDSYGKLTKMLGISNSSKKYNFYDYPENFGFWELINTPSQSLNYVPLGGESILLKWVSIKDILKNVYRRETEVIKFNSHAMKLDWKGAVRIELEDIRIKRGVPYQSSENITATQVYFKTISTGHRDRKEKRKGKCSIKRHYLKWKFIDENEFELTNGETYRPGNKIAFKNPNKKQVIFKLYAENTHLSQGYSNISCNKYANVSYKGSVRFGTSNTSITDRFDGQAKITRVYAH